MSLFGRAVLAATHNPVATKLITGTRPGKALAGRFVAGDTVDQGIEAAKRLVQSGMTVSLDLLGEEVTDVDSARSALMGYRRCLDRIAQEGMAANISVKLTQLGLSLDSAIARDALFELADVAGSHGLTVSVDMEDSRYTAATVDLYCDVQAEHGNLGLCLQAALFRTADDMERVIDFGGHIRLCKGAYVEPPEVAFQTKEEVDAAFARLLEPLMRNERVKPAIATHDDRLIQRTLELARGRTGPYEFQMLYGVRGDRQRALASAGHEIRIYVPYGSQWYPYLTRRLAERPANALFFLRALVGRR